MIVGARRVTCPVFTDGMNKESEERERMSIDIELLYEQVKERGIFIPGYDEIQDPEKRGFVGGFLAAIGFLNSGLYGENQH